MSARAAGFRLAVALLLVATFAAPGASAQEGTDVPSGDGRIFGTLIHPEGAEQAAGADVILYAVRTGAEPGIRRSRADASGRFSFEGVSTAGDVVYLLGARYEGVPFVGRRIEFAAGQTEQEVDVEVAARTPDPRGVRVAEATLRIERIGSELVANEVHRLRNPGERVIFATPEERAAGATPAFRAELPADVTRFALPYQVIPEGVVREGRDVRFYGPLYPGEQELAFTWAVAAPEDATELTVHLPSGADQLSVLVPTGVELTSSALSAAQETEIQGVRYRMAQGGPLAPGARLSLGLRVPPARTDPGALRIREARAFLEADDAAVLVSEEYHVEVSGDAPVVGTLERPLLRLALPPDARDLRFGADFRQGTTAEDGHVVVRGPVPPGTSRLDLAYRLPVEPGEGSARFVRRFDTALPVLSVYVADTGVLIESARLHRRRPVRAADERTYLHFEAFRIEPDETIELALARLAKSAAAPRGARVALVVGAALLVGFFLAAPLLRRDSRLGTRAAPGEAARRERDALYENIRDLDHDFETGKLSPEDHAQMRGELRHRAVALLQEERKEQPPLRAEAAPEPAGASCPGCGYAVGADARFCARCGRALDEAPA